MHKTLLVVAAVAGLMPGFLGAQQKPDDAIMTVVRRLFDAMRAADSATARSVFHPQARLVTLSSRQGQPRVTIESSIDGFVTAVGSPRETKWDERIFNEKINVDGALASVWVDYTFWIGERFSHCGVDHFLLVREGDDWRIIGLADTRRTEGCERR
ncbi:MAG: nuclear transport factor 2 family protein [Gemmatimonadota bacterium]